MPRRKRKSAVEKVVARTVKQLCSEEHFNEVVGRKVRLTDDLTLGQIKEVLSQVNTRHHFGWDIILDLGPSTRLPTLKFDSPRF